MKLITCANARWLPRIRPYLVSLAEYSPFDNILAGVNCHVPALFLEDLPGVRAVELPADVLAGAPSLSESVQHGAWLPYVDGPEDEIVIFTDGDILMQRRPSDDEAAFFAGLPDNAITCGWNSGPDETLEVEAGRLFPKYTRERMINTWGARYVEAPCYNIGVAAARRSTWRRIYAEYMRHWEEAGLSFEHGARQQWLVSWVIDALGLRVDLMPYSIHAHGCYALPAGVGFVDGELCYNGAPVLFRHHV